MTRKEKKREEERSRDDMEDKLWNIMWSSLSWKWKAWRFIYLGENDHGNELNPELLKTHLDNQLIFLVLMKMVTIMMITWDNSFECNSYYHGRSEIHVEKNESTGSVKEKKWRKKSSKVSNWFEKFSLLCQVFPMRWNRLFIIMELVIVEIIWTYD